MMNISDMDTQSGCHNILPCYDSVLLPKKINIDEMDNNLPHLGDDAELSMTLTPCFWRMDKIRILTQ